MSPTNREEFVESLKSHFEKNMNRQKGLEWAKVKAKLGSVTEKLWSLSEMEGTGGEPDVVGRDDKANEYLFVDCSPEVQSVAEASVMMGKASNAGKNIDRQIMRSTWQQPWGLSF